jgi:hypothetical protein
MDELLSRLSSVAAVLTTLRINTHNDVDPSFFGYTTRATTFAMFTGLETLVVPQESLLGLKFGTSFQSKVSTGPITILPAQIRYLHLIFPATKTFGWLKAVNEVTEQLPHLESVHLHCENARGDDYAVMCAAYEIWEERDELKFDVFIENP